MKYDDDCTASLRYTHIYKHINALNEQNRLYNEYTHTALQTISDTFIGFTE